MYWRGFFEDVLNSGLKKTAK